MFKKNVGPIYLNNNRTKMANQYFHFLTTSLDCQKACLKMFPPSMRSAVTLIIEPQPTNTTRVRVQINPGHVGLMRADLRVSLHVAIGTETLPAMTAEMGARSAGYHTL